MERGKFIPFHISSESEHLLDSFLSASFSRLRFSTLSMNVCNYLIWHYLLPLFRPLISVSSFSSYPHRKRNKDQISRISSPYDSLFTLIRFIFFFKQLTQETIAAKVLGYVTLLLQQTCIGENQNLIQDFDPQT